MTGISQHYQGVCLVLWITEFVTSDLNHDAQIKSEDAVTEALIFLFKALGQIYFNSCSLPDGNYRTCEKVKEKELNSTSVPSEDCISRKLEKQNIRL